MAVQKRTAEISSVEEVEAEEPIGFELNGKFYAVPRLTMKQYRKMLNLLSELDKKLGEGEDIFITEVESINATQEFYFQLFKIDYPELKKADFENLPAYMYSILYFMKIKTAILAIPLG